jgi:hypothetical protein
MLGVMSGRLVRRAASIGLWVLDVGLLIFALDNFTHGKGALLLIGWVIVTPGAFWGMRRIDREGWNKWMDRLDRGDWWG